MESRPLDPGSPEYGPSLSARFSRISDAVARGTGKPIAFAISLILIIGWAVSGPVFHYSDSWQLMINTRSSIVRLLTILLIQNAQYRQGAALHAKLDELIRATEDARAAYIGIEKLSAEDVKKMRETDRA